MIAASYTNACGREKNCDSPPRRRRPALRREIQASPPCVNGGKPKAATRILVGRGRFGLKLYFPSLRLPWRALAQPLCNSLENRPITFWLRQSSRMRFASSHSRELCRQRGAPQFASTMVPTGANLHFSQNLFQNSMELCRSPQVSGKAAMDRAARGCIADAKWRDGFPIFIACL